MTMLMRESMMPCECGCASKMFEAWYDHNSVMVRCPKCFLSIYGTTDRSAAHNWNNFQRYMKRIKKAV